MSAVNPITWVWRRHAGLMAASLLIMVAAPYLGSLPVRTIPAVVALAGNGPPSPSAELELFLGDRAGDLGAVLAFLIAAGAVAFLLALVNTRVAARLSSSANRDLARELHHRLLERPPAYLRLPGKADMLRTAMLQQTRVVASYATNTVPGAFGVFFAVAIWAQTLYTAVAAPGRAGSAALVVTAVVGVLLALNLMAVWISGKQSQAAQRAVMKEQGAFIGLASESIAHLGSLQLEVAEEAQDRRVHAVLERMGEAEVKVATWSGLATAAGSGVIMLGIPLLVLAWRTLGLRGEDLAVMIPALLMLQRSIASVGSLWTSRKVARPSIDLVTEMLLQDPHLPRSGQPLEKATGRLVFREVHWTAESREILRGVSLDVAAGETVALVGKGGCGKSSLLRLALRVDEASAGTITLDGVDTAAMAPRELRTRIGVLEQHPVFFSRSLRENLLLDDGIVTDDQIMAAARVAHIDELVARIGLDQPLPQGGQTLSGSEKRRLALTRMLLRDPDLIFVDELEAGLPQALAQALLRDLRIHTAGKTCLMVTHRPDLLEADRVALLHEGCILEIGSHAELCQRSALYRELLAQGENEP